MIHACPKLKDGRTWREHKLTKRQMSEWQPIETAPKDGTNVDLWAKCWQSYSDEFIWQRFTDCYWTNGDAMTNRVAYWRGLDTGWHATHWMQPPEGPAA